MRHRIKLGQSGAESIHNEMKQCMEVQIQESQELRQSINKE